MSVVVPITSDPVRTFVPWAGDEERKLRQRLLKAQSFASARVMRSRSPKARALLWMIIETAGEWAFAPASCGDLKDVADGLVRLVLVVETFEMLETADEA
ncbi:hypothetical protein [Sphingosinicella sp. LY1275]|uniref:hypothetical protein n=1 Tax=Sphingosinicella sp. LY1275 TaxID=3095379 RepID=UPI002ADEEA2A|nr:hypothetical protein [Sphingosinicella sp. LY1275]MEA1015600.1 hypothetical protein [Sphingosinicella sp. LY1275]